MTSTSAVKQANLQELGKMLGTGLTFLGGDIDASLSVVISQHEDEEVVLQRHIEAVEANEEMGTDARNEVPEVKLVVSEDNREAILGAIASLPQLRPMFAEQVADMVNEGREGVESYVEKVQKITALRAEMGALRQEIYDFDEENTGGFAMEDFVSWNAEMDVYPKSFIVQSNSGGTRKRAASKVKWSLDLYTAKQGDVEGPEGAYHNVILQSVDGEWVGSSDEGEIARESSANKVMKVILEAVGLSSARSANEFWGAVAAEEEEGV